MLLGPSIFENRSSISKFQKNRSRMSKFQKNRSRVSKFQKTAVASQNSKKPQSHPKIPKKQTKETQK